MPLWMKHRFTWRSFERMATTSERLHPTETAITVRVRNGKLSTTDGPFAETTEQVGGFFLVNARDLNEAIAVAAKFPSVRIGSMGVRPVMEAHRQ